MRSEEKQAGYGYGEEDVMGLQCFMTSTFGNKPPQHKPLKKIKFKSKRKTIEIITK